MNGDLGVASARSSLIIIFFIPAKGPWGYVEQL